MNGESKMKVPNYFLKCKMFIIKMKICNKNEQINFKKDTNKLEDRTRNEQGTLGFS